jgi:glycosyltransferase involved in cell wall biosynthesis
LLLEALRSQSHPVQEIEILIADGMSDDRTRDEIGAFVQENPSMKVSIIDNPARNIPAALNRALKAASGEFIVRLDAHAVPAQDYVARCLQALRAGKGENVGGVWEIVPGGPGKLASAIAAAAAHPLAVGDARYRHASQPAYVETVPFGAFRRSLVDKIGPFDETLLTNEDYEFNARILAAGGRIWLDPSIRSRYYARATLGALAGQYRRYGFWKGRMLRRYPETLRWRQALPPLFVLTLLLLALLSLFISPARVLLAGVLLVYTAVLLAAGAMTAWKRSDAALLFGFPLAVATMHLSWGGALLWSLVWWR